MTTKCDIIEKDAFIGGSKVNLLANYDQLYRQFRWSGPAAGLPIIKQNMETTLAALNDKYKSNIKSITWDDYTACDSPDEVPGQEGKYYKLDRARLAKYCGYKADPQIISSVPAPLQILAPLIWLIPIAWDVYAPPEVFLALLAGIFLALCLGLSLLSLLL